MLMLSQALVAMPHRSQIASREKRPRTGQRDPDAAPGPGFLSSPQATASLITALFFGLCLLILRPGYWINDDLKIIWSVAGYPGGGETNPFMIHSNVLLGFLLAPLYALHTTLNWEIYLFALINACSIWVVLYLILSGSTSSDYRLRAVAAVLASGAILVLSITYTVTAALASLAGICLVLASANPRTSSWRWPALGGIALMLVGSLIRIQMLILAVALVVVAMPWIGRELNWRRLLPVGLLTISVLGSCYAFDRLYVRAHPEWNTYYAYNRIRQKLHDAHRLNNLHTQIRRVGWTGNDQELFARWFYPDADRYSYDHLSYLVERTSGMSQDPAGTLEAFARRLIELDAGGRVLIMIAMAWWLFSGAWSRRLIWSMLTVWATALALNFLLALAYKNPDYVVASTIAASLMFSMMLPGWHPEGSGLVLKDRGKAPWVRAAATLGSTLLLGIAVAMLLARLIDASNTNAIKQTTYARILADLAGLQRTGAIAGDAIILSPANGLPYEWSYPFRLTRPTPSFLNTGWITFSPEYDRVLRQYKITPLPDALLQKDNLYLMTDAGFTLYLGRYFEEHRGTGVRFQSIYEMPNPAHLPGYDATNLYKVQAFQ
ncbi:MAG: hypothetical protein V1755_15650 [Chloroflexota bacterium]